MKLWVNGSTCSARLDLFDIRGRCSGQMGGAWRSARVRGAITLAAAQTISTHAPMRAFLLTIALFIAAGALVIQGLTLPGLIRIVKPKMATGDISEEERAKLLKVMGSALVDTALAQAIHEVDGQTLLSAGVSRTLSRIGHAVNCAPKLGRFK